MKPGDWVLIMPDDWDIERRHWSEPFLARIEAYNSKTHSTEGWADIKPLFENRTWDVYISQLQSLNEGSAKL